MAPTGTELSVCKFFFGSIGLGAGTGIILSDSLLLIPDTDVPRSTSGMSPLLLFTTLDFGFFGSSGLVTPPESDRLVGTSPSLGVHFGLLSFPGSHSPDVLLENGLGATEGLPGTLLLVLMERGAISGLRGCSVLSP